MKSHVNYLFIYFTRMDFYFKWRGNIIYYRKLKKYIYIFRINVFILILKEMYVSRYKKKSSERINHEKLIVDWISLFVRNQNYLLWTASDKYYCSWFLDATKYFCNGSLYKNVNRKVSIADENMQMLIWCGCLINSKW